jgi:hypothetical protein
MDWSTRLIQIYLFCCEHYKSSFPVHCQRMSNNFHPDFTYEEVATIYLFGRFWPKLQAWGVLWKTRLLDSMPIMIAKAKRSAKAKVARHFANKGYCASKDIYYYGAKLHILGLKRQGTLPIPDYVGLTPAADHDLPAFKIIAPALLGGEVYADKAYIDELLKQRLKEKQDLSLWTPVKKEKGQEELLLLDRLLSQAVSSIRQPIESLFNWIEQKTGIQIASRVRSYNGLLIHVFGRLAAAMFILVFNS